MQDSPVVKAEGLTKRFGKAAKQIVAVDDLSIEVRRGNIFGFLGPNGSGKTTTIGMLLGLIRPTSGEIELFGQNIRQDLPSLLRRTSAVMENSPLYPYLSAYDNLRYFTRAIGGINPSRIEEVLEIVGLRKRAKSKTKTYSLGMKQRLSIAIALLNDPEFIILDEPTNGMDPSGIIEVRELIGELGKQGTTIFLSSHLLHEVEQVCNHVAILNKGRVIAQGPVGELLHRGKRLQLCVSDIESAILFLNNIEWITTIETDDKFLFVEAPEEKAPEVNEILVKNGIRVSEMKMSELSLEDFFLDTIDEETEAAGEKNA